MSKKPVVRVNTAGQVTALGDGFGNIITGLGQNNAKVRAHQYGPPVVTQSEVEVAYRTSTWFGKIVDIAAEDATREWRAWQATKEQIEALEATESRLQVRQRVLQALTWARLYGGAVIIPGGLRGLPETPLPERAVDKGGVTFLHVMHRYQITANGINRDPLSPYYGMPDHFSISTGEGQQTRIHPSRVIVINGRRVSNTTGGQDFWGDSIWTYLSDAVLAADAGAAVLDALMQEAKIDVVRVNDFIGSLGNAEYEATAIRRWQMVAVMKSISNVLLMDKNDEYTQKQISWAGLPQVLDTLLTNLAGAADYPKTRLTGEQQTGLSGADSGSIRNYYDGVKAKQELHVAPMLGPLDDLIIQSALGSRPPEIWYQWKPLWQPTAQEQAATEKTKAETVQIYVNSGLVPDDAMAVMVQNRLVESGQWPGADTAYDAKTMDFDEPEPPADPDDPDAAGELLPGQAGRRQQQQDAAPRTLYVQRRVLNGKAIAAHYKAQGFETTLLPEDMHVTIAFSRAPVDWFKMGENYSGDGKGNMTVAAGGPRMMDLLGPQRDAMVLLFASSALSWRHEEMKRLGVSWDWPEYQPHITISYGFAGNIRDVEPWQGPIELGPEIFEEVNEDWKSEVKEA